MNPKLKKTVLTGIVGILILSVGSFVFLFNKKINSSDSALVKYGDLVEAVYGLGTVTANQTFQLKIGITTSIKELFVREGDSVKAGAPLVRMDEGGIFKVPFSGTVTSLPFKVGETVYPQTPIATVMNLTDRYIVVSVEQEGALRVQPGQAAKMSVESLRGQIFTGKVRALFPGDGQFLVHIDIPNLPAEVIPGMTGDVAIEVAKRSHILMLPVSAVQSGRVLVKRGGFAKKVQITLGAIDGRWAEITGGELREGDEVVLPKR